MEVNRAVLHLDGKAWGVDGLRSEMVKNEAAIIFKKCVQQYRKVIV